MTKNKPQLSADLMISNIMNNNNEENINKKMINAILNKYLDEICNNLYKIEAMNVYLISNDAIMDQDDQLIMAEKTRFLQAKKLCEIIKMKAPGSFIIFLNGLKLKGHSYLADLLIDYAEKEKNCRIIYEIENDITERYEKKDEIYETTVQSRNDENKNYENSLTSCVSEKPNEFNDPYEGLFVENTVRDPESYELPDVPLIVEEKEVLDEINYKNQAVAKISSLSNDLNMSPLSGTFADFANGRIGVASNNILHSSLHSKMKEYISVQDIRLLKYLTVMQADIFKWRIQKYGYLRENYQLPRTLAIKVNPFWFINIPPVAIYEEFTFCRPDAPLIVLCSLDQLVPSQAIQSNFNATEASFCARDDIMAQIQLAGRAIAAASIESTQRVHDTNEHHVPNEFNNYEHVRLLRTSRMVNSELLSFNYPSLRERGDFNVGITERDKCAWILPMMILTQLPTIMPDSLQVVFLAQYMATKKCSSASISSKKQRARISACCCLLSPNPDIYFNAICLERQQYSTMTALPDSAALRISTCSKSPIALEQLTVQQSVSSEQVVLTMELSTASYHVYIAFPAATLLKMPIELYYCTAKQIESFQTECSLFLLKIHLQGLHCIFLVSNILLDLKEAKSVMLIICFCQLYMTRNGRQQNILLMSMSSLECCVIVLWTRWLQTVFGWIMVQQLFSCSELDRCVSAFCSPQSTHCCGPG